MTMKRLSVFLLLATVLSLTACNEHPDTLVAPPTSETAAEKAHTSKTYDQAFLASLQVAFDETEWERVRFSEVKRGGTQVAYPKSFEKGDHMAVSVILGKNSPKEVPEVEVYVPVTQGNVPGKCVLFKFNGLVEDAEYIIETYLPAWFVDLDLGAQHNTFQLVRSLDGQTYTAAFLTTYLTPPTPWLQPPVTISILAEDPSVQGHAKWTVDTDTTDDD